MDRRRSSDPGLKWAIAPWGAGWVRLEDLTSPWSPRQLRPWTQGLPWRPGRRPHWSQERQGGRKAIPGEKKISNRATIRRVRTAQLALAAPHLNATYCSDPVQKGRMKSSKIPEIAAVAACLWPVPRRTRILPALPARHRTPLRSSSPDNCMSSETRNVPRRCGRPAGPRGVPRRVPADAPRRRE